MIPGIVTNCFQHQLNAGMSLRELISESAGRGYQAIELRQGSLGEYESADRFPDAVRLAELPERFPGVRFDYAMEYPFLSADNDPHTPILSAGKWAADAVAGESPPHLRLVDLKTTAADLASSKATEIAQRLAHLVESMTEVDGVLSIENGPHPWEPFRRVFALLQENAGPDAHRLMLCYDPVNLLFCDDRPNPADVTASLNAASVSMVHFKQRKDNQPLSFVGDGEVDWQAQSTSLQDIHYAGPGLFEIAPSENVWDALAASEAYLSSLGITFSR